MKSARTAQTFPELTQEQIEAMIAGAPEGKPNPEQLAALASGVMVKAGAGPQGVRVALEARRGRGPGKKPAKVPVTLRMDAEVLALWRASGEGWRTRLAAMASKHAPK